MSTFQTIKDWIQRASADQGNAVHSVHFNELIDIHISDAAGYKLVAASIQIIKKAISYLNLDPNLPENNGAIIVYLPIDNSGEMLMWNYSLWEMIKTEQEPPSLYLIQSNNYFDIMSEEYRCPVSCPQIASDDIIFLFRSFRPASYIESDLEFFSGIYLIQEIKLDKN